MNFEMNLPRYQPLTGHTPENRLTLRYSRTRRQRYAQISIHGTL